jgi:mono/diheme cytochrome c family protein
MLPRFVFLILCALSLARAEEVLFRREVQAVLQKAGCNGGGCHGNGQGKGGLKLSLWGEDPALDWTALVQEQGGRRVNLLEPERSLLLQKATAELAHEGGRRLAPGSPEYAVLLAWLRAGAEDSGVGVKVTRLEVSPVEQVLVEPEQEVALRVTAHFADGTVREVTREAVYEPNNLGARVSADGRVSRAAFGETTVLVRYLGQSVPVTLAFVPARPGFAWAAPPAHNFIDELLFAKLERLRINPSGLCDDATFVRRAYLDLLGVIPSAETARAFVADPDPAKRAALIDRLLQREEFFDYWALKWADLLRIEERQLDATGMQVFHGWIRASLAANKPLDVFARELVAARGSTYENPPANWYRANRDPVQRAENTARVFLGTQLNCAQCHNHPFDRWTQDDYYSWAAVFARVDYEIKDNQRKDKNDQKEFKGDQIVKLKSEARYLHARTGQPAEPRLLGAGPPEMSPEIDELTSAADWLVRTPLFARMQVNRVWYHLFGRGLVEPVDDFRASNPPAHPAVLEALARDFAGQGYDLRRLIRTIMTSRTYQLSAMPNETNAEDTSFFSRALVTRLGAEQIIDSTAKALGVPLAIPGYPAAQRLAQVPEGRRHYYPVKTDLDRYAQTFGKPPRLVASECERNNEVAMPQVFTLLSGSVFHGPLTAPDNVLASLLTRDDTELVETLAWSLVGRAPGERERQAFSSHLAGAEDRRRAAEDIAWALLNAKEFLFRH